MDTPVPTVAVKKNTVLDKLQEYVSKLEDKIFQLTEENRAMKTELKMLRKKK
jgi:chaperonin cofactor prefoldin